MDNLTELMQDWAHYKRIETDCQNERRKIEDEIISSMNIDRLIERALREDIGSGDITSSYLNLENDKSIAFLIAKERGILAGLNVAIAVFRKLDPAISWVAYKKDGDNLKKGDEIIKFSGSTCAILAGERVALNFLQP